MPRFTVLIPTHDHGPTIAHAIASVQGQSEQDFELFVIGDGAPPITGEIVSKLAATDPRIRWFPNPKGEGHGELWRHAALQQATGEMVCYLSDDDLWLPQHLTELGRLLTQADFAKTLYINIAPDGSVLALPGDITMRSMRRRMLAMKWNCFGPTCAGHTMAAYRRLPSGWCPRPEGMWTDLWFWRQWFSQPWCRFASRPLVTTLHFPSPDRPGLNGTERCAELMRWSPRLGEPSLAAELTAAGISRWERRIERGERGLKKSFAGQQMASTTINRTAQKSITNKSNTVLRISILTAVWLSMAGVFAIVLLDEHISWLRHRAFTVSVIGSWVSSYSLYLLLINKKNLTVLQIIGHVILCISMLLLAMFG